MMRLMMYPTDEYERLVKFFVENGLEFDGDEEVDTDIVKCYKITHGDDFLVGAVVLAKRQGNFIIDGIAVDKMYRKMNVGETLLKKAIEQVKERGGNSLYLVARAPEFFRKNGFVTVDSDAKDAGNVPSFYECKQCPQYQVSCHPEVMKLEF